MVRVNSTVYFSGKQTNSIKCFSPLCKNEAIAMLECVIFAPCIVFQLNVMLLARTNKKLYIDNNVHLAFFVTNL